MRIQILGIILSLDFADTAIIETIATAKTIMAIVPNSGTTCVPTISILVSPSFTGMSIERNSLLVSTFLKSVRNNWRPQQQNETTVKTNGQED